MSTKKKKLLLIIIEVLLRVFVSAYKQVEVGVKFLLRLKR